MIGKRLAMGIVSEVVPVAPRPDVRAPLVMERLLPHMHSPQLLTHAGLLSQHLATLPAPWQRLVDAQFNRVEHHFIYERFVGVTLRDVSAGLRRSRRVLPPDVLRALVDRICDALEDLSRLSPMQGLTQWQWLGLTDRSLGLSLDGRWHFAVGALNHWLVAVGPPDELEDPEAPVPGETLGFLSPETTAGREETPASFVTRAALLSWQLATGGFHPFRGRPHELASDFMRFVQGDVRVGLSVNPTLSPEVVRVFERGISWATERYEHLDQFRAALDEAWPVKPASQERTLHVLASVAWTELEQALEALKREPMLPIQWDGVWTATQSPEAGIAVLQDQLLEHLEPVENLPARSPLPASATVSAEVPLYVPSPPSPPRRPVPERPPPVPAPYVLPPVPGPYVPPPPSPSPRSTPPYLVPPRRRSLLQRLRDFFGF